MRTAAWLVWCCGCGRTELGAEFDSGEVDAGAADERGADERGAADDSADDHGDDHGRPDVGARPCDPTDHATDRDSDGIPDTDDPFATDATRPGRARDDVVYVHSATTLTALSLDGGDPFLPVGEFSFPEDGGGEVTDIAIDRFGVMYALVSADLYTCDPATATCWWLAPLPSNSLGFVPQGLVETDDDILFTLAGSDWTRVDLCGAQVRPQVISTLPGYSSSGDIATNGPGVTAFTSPAPAGGDVVVSIDPATGTVLGELGIPATIYGQWGMAAYMFVFVLCDQLGTVSVFEPISGTASVVFDAPHECWGAAAHPNLR